MDLEFGDAEATSSASSVMSNAAASERLLSTGILEIGNPSAPVTMMLATHHSCGYCREFTESLLPRLTSDFIAKGSLKVQIVPLTLKKYPESQVQARTLLCAGKQSKGLAMHKALFTKATLNDDAAKLRAKELKLDAKVFEACMADAATDAGIQTQQTMLQGLNVTLLPTLIINGTVSTGLPYYPDVRGMVEEAMKKS